MPERTAEEAYGILLEALREHRLSWVAEQIQNQIRAGKPTTRVVAPTPSLFSSQYVEKSTRVRRPRSERLAATEPYTPTERLMLALEAIERAIVQTSDLEDEILKFLSVEGKVPAIAIFAPEELEDAERREFGRPPTTRRQAVVGLGQAVAVLRMEAARGHH